MHMAWGMIFGSLEHEIDIENQRAEVDRLREEIRRSHSGSTGSLEKLQAQNDELRLFLAVTIRILISKGVVTEDEMKRIVYAIDAEDGTLDGKYTGHLSDASRHGGQG
jgi:hypothetical protein